MIKKALATAAIALVAVFGVPMAANAAYVPAEDISVSDTTPAPGQAVTVAFDAGSFTPGETVTLTVDGEGTATIAMVKAAVVSASKAAAADGSASFVVTLPANATGSYAVTAVGGTSGNIATVTLTVVPADAGAGTGLPVTGAEISAGVIWIAGGALVLGAVLLAVVGLRRRAASQQ